MKHFVNNSSNKQVNTSSTVGGFDISFESKDNKNKKDTHILSEAAPTQLTFEEQKQEVCRLKRLENKEKFDQAKK